VSHLPSFSSSFDLDVRAIGSHYHSSGFVGADHLGAKLGQGTQDIDTWMSVLVPGADRNDRNIGVNRGQKCIAGAGRAPVMPNLQNIGVQLIPMPIEEPVLLCPLGVSNKQKAHQPETGNGHSACEIRILQSNGPG
jgi:hypothetical protein